MDNKEMQINVMHLVDTLEVGGLERVVSELSLGLDKSKYNVEICCIVSGGAVADELSHKGISVHILGIYKYGKWKNIKKLAVFLKESGVDIIHMHGAFAQKIGVIASLIAGVPVKIMHVHTTFYNMNLKNVFIDKILRNFLDRIIYISNSCLVSFKKEGYRNGKKSSVIYNGVHVPDQSGIREKENGLVCTIVASLTLHKGHKYLLRAIHQLKDYDGHIKLRIVGDGPLRDELVRMVRELEIDEQVEFLGIRNDVKELLNETDIFVLPSIREGMSLALAEAMAAGKAIIASKVGGIPELISDGKNGLLVEPKNTEQLVERIRNLIFDQDMRDRLGQQARVDCERQFSLEIMLDKIDKLYQECLGEKK